MIYEVSNEPSLEDIVSIGLHMAHMLEKYMELQEDDPKLDEVFDQLMTFSRLFCTAAVVNWKNHNKTSALNPWEVHEMLFIEKGGEEQIPGELAAYNPLIPQGRELVATVMLEIEDPVRRAAALMRLGGIDPLSIAWSMNVSASLVDLSSLSTVGALYIAGAAPGTDVRKLFNGLLVWGLSMSLVGAALIAVPS